MLSLIRIFIKVVEQGSFSKAGRILNMAPSSVTRKIDALENQLGVSLFKRSTRQLILTTEGELFIEGANEISKIHSDGRQTHYNRIRNKDSLQPNTKVYTPITRRNLTEFKYRVRTGSAGAPCVI